MTTGSRNVAGRVDLQENVVVARSGRLPAGPRRVFTLVAPVDHGQRQPMDIPLKALLSGLASVFLALNACAALTPEEIKSLPPASIERSLPDEHPSSYYLYAVRLFAEGKKDDAVFWFYTGQIRFRAHLKANPDLKPSGDPALFASLNATLGREINEYAGGDPKMWFAQIDRALAWDRKMENGFTSKKKFKKEYEEIRSGLLKMKEGLEKNVDQLREQRKKAGLENRG